MGAASVVPKGFYSIEFGKLLPGDEFVTPDNINKVLVKRRSGGRFCHAEPAGLYGDSKIVYARKGERQDRMKGIEETLVRMGEAVKSLTADVRRLRGYEPEEPEAVPATEKPQE